jgi:hypothetical protein
MFDIIEFIRQFIKGEIPTPGNLDKWKEIFEEMSVHTRKAKPESLLLKRRPNEDPEVTQYRLDNFEPITYGSMNRALDEATRIIGGVNFTVQNASEKLLAYIKNQKFEGVPFNLFMEQNAFKRCIEDPNGLFVTLPHGEGVENSAKEVNPFVYFVYSGDIKYLAEDAICFLSEEKSPLRTTGNKVEYCGDVYYILDKVWWYKLKQVGTKSKPEWELVYQYQHKMNHVPYGIFRGDYCSDGYYNSYFGPYNAFANEAIRQFSDSQAVHIMSAYPLREEFYAEVDAWKAVEKSNNPVDENEQKFEGSTELKPFSRSPHSVIIRKIPPADGAAGVFQAELPADVPSVRFIHPEVDIVKYTADSWKQLLELAEKALNLTTSNFYRSEGQQEMDEAPKLSMIQKIGNNFYDNLLLQTLRYFEAYLNNKPYSESLTIVKPSVFDLKTEADIVEEISTLTDKKAPIVFLSEATKDLAKKRFSGNLVSQKIFEVISTYDPFFIYTSEQKDSMVLSGSFDKDPIKKSIVMPTLLQSIVNTMTPERFIGATNEAIYAEFEKLYLKTFPPSTAGQIVGEDGSLDSIGKFPLAIQQLALAKMRAEESGDKVLAGKLSAKMDQLLDKIE